MLEMIVFHTAVLYIILRYMQCFFDTVRVKKGRDLEAYVLYLAAVCLVDMVPAAMPLKYITDTFFLYLLVQIYHGKQGKKLLAASLIQGMNLFCEVLAVYLLYDCKVDGIYGREMYYITFLLMYVCQRVIEKFCIRNIKQDAALKHWDLLIFLPMISVIVICVLITFDLENKYIGSAVSAGMICLNLIVFYICDELVGTYMQLKESAVVARQLESYSNQLNVVMKSEEKVRGLRHDLKHHLSQILMLADKNKTSEIAEYVRSMQEDLLSRGEHISSGNADIDSLVNLMLERAKKELGNVRCRVCVPQELDISGFDWNIILGNLMDNAIDAARQSEDKLLQLKIHYRQGMLFIEIRNSFSGELLKTQEQYLSTKDHDRTDGSQVHGLGIRNVRRIVEKYDGSMEISDRDHIFEVRILLYVSVKKEK